MRFHIVQNLARDKCYFSAFLFLKASSYRRLEPFSNIFGVTSRLVLTQQSTSDELAQLRVETLAGQLYELRGHPLPEPLHNARKLQRVADESFVLDPSLALPDQRILDFSLDRIRFLETQLDCVDNWVATELEAHPVFTQLATIPGVGPIFCSGIGAEIGGIQCFLQPLKWDNKRKRYRHRNLRDAEDAVAKVAGLWWSRANSSDFEAEERRKPKSGNRFLR